MFRVCTVESVDVRVKSLIDELDAYQASLYPAESNHLDSMEELARDHVRMFGAFEDDVLVGCGAVKRMSSEYGEIKRMFVSHRSRGTGAADAILGALEAHLAGFGTRFARLETGIHQTAALRFYERHGYRRTGPFGDYHPDPLSVFMEKRLGPDSRASPGSGSG